MEFFEKKTKTNQCFLTFISVVCALAGSLVHSRKLPNFFYSWIFCGHYVLSVVFFYAYSLKQLSMNPCLKHCTHTQIVFVEFMDCILCACANSSAAVTVFLTVTVLQTLYMLGKSRCKVNLIILFIMLFSCRQRSVQMELY